MATARFARVRRFAAKSRSTRSYSSGLFGRDELSSADGLHSLTNTTISEAEDIVAKIKSYQNHSLETVDLFDELSNTLCRTADLAECIRLLHPDKRYVDFAQESCLRVSSYVETLNTNQELYHALRSTTDHHEKYSNLPQDTIRHIESLLHDFEISGIHLDRHERDRVVMLNDLILSRNHQFISNCSTPTYVNKTSLPSKLQNYFPSNGDTLIIDHTPFMCNDKEVRELGYRLYHSVNAQRQDQLLDELLKAKYELACLVGHKSFSHRALKNSMAGSPEVVWEFLNTLSDKLLPLATEEANEAMRMNNTDHLPPWDVPWVSHLAKQQYLGDVSRKDTEEYFPLDACLNGVDQLFRSLFGICLKENQLMDGEAWESSVRKFSFVEEESGNLLGELYCDFYYRPNKLQADCQFTIQGCRRLSNGEYQLPVSTLNLCLPSGDTQSPCLSQPAVENLFHEMGHAAHSIIGRTRYQNLSGTRCPTDFAEVPSNLMELFLRDARVLKSFTRSSSDLSSAMPDKMIAAFQLSGNIFPALTAQSQIVMAMLDQVFHSTHPLDTPYMEIYANLHRSYSPISQVPGVATFLRFAHLATYPGKYYSYLWARAVANLIWRRCFKHDPFSESMGRLYRDRVLAYGGGETPNVLVQGLLGYQPSIDELVDSYYQEITELKTEIISFKS